MNTKNVTGTVVSTLARESNSLKVKLGLKSLIKLDAPFKINDDGDTTLYVVISTVTVFGVVETFAFPANSDGMVTSYIELEGSMKGTGDHEEVISAMGITIR
jgi:hypothetical protein